ncbi:putative 5-methyltetrahydropteroyltriglutamate-homocysteine methyltransferase [Rosellinia necatrix]|uniref:Putative 5-methyltetrahydropteroyltriglutamate-homocysteine methyltransferase n=1 Tax=Rosellinia necatrix TaxID=77044 RepID=A0A1W2TVB9_ROSNE|nr:putative 5-methyltetrahydropteroyltriglutamate-homocysteine methyltransferase [Rosellinia necatrix]
MAPFRAEQMGSLLRPADLLEIRAAVRDKGITPEEAGLPAAEKRAVADVVKLQQGLGFRAITSGEFTRTRFWGLMWDEFEGTVQLQDAEASMFRLYHPDVVSLLETDRHVMPGESVIVGGKLSHDASKSVSNLHELRLVQATVPESEWGDIKLTMITPAWFHMRYAQGRAYTAEAYSSDAEYFADVAAAYRAELALLYGAGLRNVQFDDPGMAYFCSERFRTGWEGDAANAGTAEQLLDAYIELYNACVRGAPDDMHFGIHLCRGNFIGGRHFAEGAYDVIARKLFRDLRVHTFYLEYDTERAGGFEPLRFLPAGKSVVLGVVSTKLRELEDKDEMKRRVHRAAEFVAEGRGESVDEALKSICVSPQCGFSTHESGYPLSLEDERAKLALVRQIADEIWGEP